MTTFKTWASLKPSTPFSHLFPDGRVPIRSIMPIIPGEAGNPPCYLVPGNQLTAEQICGLAQMLVRTNPECKTLEQAIAYIRDDALPLRTDWFTGISSVDQGMMLSLAEFGEELRSVADEDEAWDEWEDDENYVIEDEFGHVDRVMQVSLNPQPEKPIAWIDGEAVYREDEP